MIKSEETIAIEFERRMRDIAMETSADAILIQMNPRVSAEFTANEARVLHSIEEETGKVFVFEGSEGLPLEHFAVLLEGDREQVLERALPFREGEEVHVEIVEPHMYSPGDAVAKIDGYIISIRGGTKYVGEKHLVRIDEVGRTSAVASLVDVGPGAQNGDGSSDSGDELESKPRRRGRRGGRRRSSAKASVIFVGVDMYAIVKTGGKQYRVEQGQSLLVERLPVADGDTVALQPLLLVDGADVVDGDDLASVTVEAEWWPTSAGPSSAWSSSSPSAATSGAPATARS